MENKTPTSTKLYIAGIIVIGLIAISSGILSFVYSDSSTSQPTSSPKAASPF